MKNPVVSFVRLPRLIFTFGIAALLGSLAVSTHAVTIDMVPVGNPGNANDPATGNVYGGVAYDYQIGKYDVTIGQYTEFLNAVAKTDTYSLYNANMGTKQIIRGIAQTGTSGAFTYSVIAPSGTTPAGASSPGNRPITFVSWFDSARFANWLANGQPTGAQTSTTTENGAYNVNGATEGTAPVKNVTNPNTGAPPTFYIPTENEWYKAAYYSPVLNSGSGGYYTYATQSNAAPGNVIGSAANQANYAPGGVFSVTQSSSYDINQNYLTDVGAFTGSGSFYGTFDQNGIVWQWNDLTGDAGSYRGRRGGNWDNTAGFLASSFRDTSNFPVENSSTGFRLASPVAVPEPSTYAMALAGLACGGWQMVRRRRTHRRIGRSFLPVALLAFAAAWLCTAPAHAVTIDMVPVGNPGNANDPATGNLYGGVAYDYQIGKYDVTIGQYTAFLNAVAKTDTYSLYNANMATEPSSAGISQTGTSGAYTYSVIAPSGTTPAGASSPGNRPITYVSWWDSARFANWLANGQPTGAQTSTTTENGAYNVNGATRGNAPARNVTNPNTSAPPTFYIPTENEWYKAAYYSPVLNSGSGGYYKYATQSNADPGNQIGSGANQANYAPGGVFSVTQSSSYDLNQNYLTDVGAFTGSGSFYGTFDQSGNVFQWNDLDGTAGPFRGTLGGGWDGSAFDLSSTRRDTNGPSFDNSNVGFRLASPVAVPEPSTWASLLAGLACGGYSLFRRRRAR